MSREKVLHFLNYCFQFSCVLIAVVLAVKYSQISWHHMMSSDLGVYLRAGRVLAEAGNIYQENPAVALPEDAIYYFPYIYTPFVAVFCYGLLFLNESTAGVLWLFFNFLALWFSAQFITKSSKQSIGFPFLALLLFPPTVDGWFFGQVNPFVLSFIAAGHSALLQSKNRTAGALLAIASLIKICPIVLLVTIIKFKRWDALLYFFITSFLIIICCSCTPRGFRAWLDFISALPDISSAGSLFSIPANFSLSHALFQLRLGFTEKSAINAVYFCSLPVLLFLLFSPSFQSKDGLSYHLGAVMCVMLLTSPILWPHHFLWILIPLAIVIENRARIVTGSAYAIGGALSLFFLIECLGRHSGNNWITSEQTIYSVGIIMLIASLLVITLLCSRRESLALEA